MRRVWGVGIAAVVTLALVSCSGGTTQRVNVAAAADLRYALNEIIALAQDANPETEFAVTYGSSGQFLQQIVNGAPFDLYLSADEAFPQQLVDEGLATDPFPYAIGRLVLWVPEASPLDPRDGLSVLADARRISIANPEHAPYGERAKQVLQHAGLWSAVQSKLILGENISQAAQFALSGSAQAGIIAQSLAVAPAFTGKGRFDLINAKNHQPLIQRMVLIKPVSAAAQSFYDYLGSAPAQAVLSRYGFAMP